MLPLRWPVPSLPPFYSLYLEAVVWVYLRGYNLAVCSCFWLEGRAVWPYFRGFTAGTSFWITDVLARARLFKLMFCLWKMFPKWLDFSLQFSVLKNNIISYIWLCSLNIIKGKLVFFPLLWRAALIHFNTKMFSVGSRSLPLALTSGNTNWNLKESFTAQRRSEF